MEECFVCKARNGKVFTAREEEILEEIRRITMRFRMLRRRIEELEASGVVDSEELFRAKEELEALRKKRQDLELERVDAAKERMRLLGHE